MIGSTLKVPPRSYFFTPGHPLNTAANAPPSTAGLLYSLAGHIIWGLMPLYVWAVVEVPAFELLAHRIIWSALMLGILVVAMGRSRLAWQYVRDPRTRRYLAVSTTLIGLNWFVFLYAVLSKQVLQTSLGYFIGPLVNVALGVIVLGERLRPAQKVALVLAAAGVAAPLMAGTGFPWIALTLAFAFGIYGLCRKKAGVDGLTGTTIEAVSLLPAAVGFAIWVATHEGLYFWNKGLGWSLLLIAAGPVVATPLLCYSLAVRRLKLSTLGFMQYLTPSMSFLLAVFVLGEEFTTDKKICFGFIWSALAVFTWDLTRSRRENRARRASEADVLLARAAGSQDAVKSGGSPSAAPRP